MISDDNPILEVRGLKVGIEGTPILKGIDLVIPKGEIHAIMGLSLIHISEPTRP